MPVIHVGRGVRRKGPFRENSVRKGFKFHKTAEGMLVVVTLYVYLFFLIAIRKIT